MLLDYFGAIYTESETERKTERRTHNEREWNRMALNISINREVFSFGSTVRNLSKLQAPVRTVTLLIYFIDLWPLLSPLPSFVLTLNLAILWVSRIRNYFNSIFEMAFSSLFLTLFLCFTHSSSFQRILTKKCEFQALKFKSLVHLFLGIHSTFNRI